MPPSPYPTRVPDPVRLLPDLTAAAFWSLWAALLVTAAAWFVVDSFGDPLAWVGLVVAVAFLAWFAFQLILPKRFQVILDPDVLWVRQAWRRLTIDWDDVYVVRVRHVLGDALLEVQRKSPDDATEPGDRTIVPLPVGTDIRPIHRFLAARLGHGALPTGRLEPLDLG
jgi:hypothetical protein